MFLSDDQKRILELVKTYGCLRKSQIETFLTAVNEYFRMDVSIRQLLYLNLIQSDNDIISENNRQPDYDALDAIDALLCFPLPDIQLHKPASEPFLLTFFKNNTDGKLCRYDICKCTPSNEHILAVQLEGLNEKYRIIIIILNNKEQQNKLHISSNHCFMIREGDTFKIYKSKTEWRNPNE